MTTTFVEMRQHGPFLPTQRLPAWTARYQPVRSLCARDGDFRTRVLCAITLNERSRLINQAKHTAAPTLALPCDSCGQRMTVILAPSVGDDIEWARVAEEHLPTCNYVATRGRAGLRGEDNAYEQSA